MEPAEQSPLAVSSRVGRDLVWTVGGAIAVAFVVRFLSPVILPVVLALFLASLLSPIVAMLERRGRSRSSASLLALLGGIAVAAVVVLLAVIPFARQASSLVDSARAGVADLSQVAAEHDVVSAQDADELRTKLLSFAGTIAEFLLKGLAGGIASVASIGATLFLTLPLVFFLLKDGARGWALRRVKAAPRPAGRHRPRPGGSRSPSSPRSCAARRSSRPSMPRWSPSACG